jgi:TonB family protein
MQNPFFSFVVAFLIWISCVAIFSFSIFKKTEIPNIAIEIDASMLGEVNREQKIPKNFPVKKPDSEKISDLKKDQQKDLQHDHHLEDVTEKIASTKLKAIFNPLPSIPYDLREEAFVSEALARFYINADGSVAKVELIKPCINPRLNNLLLKSLRSWKFVANSVDSTQDIRVSFKVE